MTKKTINNPNNQSEIPSTPFAYFWYVSKPFKWWMFGAIFMATLASGLGQGSAYFFKLIIDAVEIGNHESALMYALLYPLIIFVVQLCFRGSGFTGIKYIVQAEKNSYDLLSQYTMRHSHSYFSDRFAGSVLSKINNVTNSIDRLASDIIWMHLLALVSVLVTIGFLLFIDVSSAFIFIGLIIVLVLFNYLRFPAQTQCSKAAAQSATDLRARLVDTVGNVQSVRQYVRNLDEVEGIKSFSNNLKQTAFKRYMRMEITLFWNSFILFVFSSTMFWFLVVSWRAGSVSTGDLVLILALYSQVTTTLIFIGRAFGNTARVVGEMKEGLDDLLVPYEIVDVLGSKSLVVDEAGINWSKVGFSFEGQAVFAGFNLDIPAGQRLGLVGQSGAGKTTFVSLLLRQHDIETGSITIDGQDISQVTQDSLRQMIAVVPQEPALFHRSIRENILYGNHSASEEELVEVAKMAQAHEFIMKLPEGYDTMVGERGVKLSGGQKQRVAIARAMLKDAPILVLDEATSALDSESEVAIQKALEKLMEGRTVIAVAHRLSTLRKMDRIIVLENGSILEDGNHETLAKGGGVYERLWNHQAGGFMQD